MVSLTALWLPILLSAVLVFIASSVIHMALPWHRGDYRKLPNEDDLLAAMRPFPVAPGDYVFPCPERPGDVASAELQDKYRLGPVGLVSFVKNGPPAMAASLIAWFLMCLAIGTVSGYLAGIVLPPGADYRLVFRVVSVAAFLGYGGSHVSNAIWKGQGWGANLRHTIDGLVYGLLTAGVFGWLWPQ